VALILAPPAAAAPSLDAKTRLRVESIVSRQLEKRALPGAIVAIRRDGRKRWLSATGVSNLETRRPMRRGDHVRVGSVTKAFVTTLLLDLQEDGLLSLDDPISAYVEGVPGGDRITLRQLANMTSGLADYFGNEQFSFEYLTGETFTPEHLVELGITLPTLFPPGTGWSYSNTNTALLGLVIEQVSGQKLQVALRQRVFRPLGLGQTSLPTLRRLPRPFAHGYTRQTSNGALGDATSNTPTATWAGGGIVSTVGDLTRAARMFGTGRPILSRASQREREQWVGFPPNSPKQRYGIGVFDFSGWIGHNGGIPGYTTIAWYLPAKRMSLVVAVNSDIHRGPTLPNYAYEPASEIASRLTRVLSPRHVAPPAVKVR
jgi:D-alanyl-D-alanine carboxypeptidase